MLTPVATKTTTRMKGGITEEEPADLHIPDNYVEFALKNAKPLPPITWNNWWKELNYLSVAILTISPSIAIYGALTTKLHPATAAFAVFYYFFTGLGPYLSYHYIRRPLVLMISFRHHGRIPPSLVSSLVQRFEAPAGVPRIGWCRRRPGLH